MLKDSWKDKINGESIVDAEDINKIAHSVMDLENNSDSIELAQDVEGDSTEKAVSQKAVKDALGGKVSKASNKSGKNIPWYDPSTGGEGAYTPAFDALGGTIPLRSENGEIRTGLPTQDAHAANKKYVDNKARALEQGVYNALGTVYTTEEVTDFGVGISIPSGALKYAYIESLGVINGCDNDGKVIGECVLRGVTVGENNYEIQTPMYIEIPDGALSISIEADVPTGTVYTQGKGGKIVFQVKVGG